jgi:hypothetical protein
VKIRILSQIAFSLGHCDKLIVSRDEDQRRRFHLAERDMDLLRGSKLHCIIGSQRMTQNELTGSFSKRPGHFSDLVFGIQVVAQISNGLGDIRGRQETLALTASEGTQHLNPGNARNDDTIVR